MISAFSEVFRHDFYDKMLKPSHPSNPIRNRADNFLEIFKILEKKHNKNFRIIETGTMRPDHGALCFGDDGASTYIFDKFINFYDGELLSVDISPINVEHASKIVSKKSKIFCEDSVNFLWRLQKDKDIDLIYLDSFDIKKDDPHPSQLHHIKELCAVIDKIRKGTILVVDDHDAFFTNHKIGKGTYVKEFMNNIDAKLIFENYQIGWIF